MNHTVQYETHTYSMHTTIIQYESYSTNCLSHELLHLNRTFKYDQETYSMNHIVPYVNQESCSSVGVIQHVHQEPHMNQ